MGFFDKAKEFAGKKYHEIQEAEKKRAVVRSAEKAAYDEEFQKARLSAMKSRARLDARASVFPRKGTAQKSMLSNIGRNAANFDMNFNPLAGSDKKFKKVLQ